MPKRSSTDNHEERQVIKKHIVYNNSASKIRNIRSLSSERSLQLLYQGASKKEDPVNDTQNCSNCTLNKRCWYCSKNICNMCIRHCNICDEKFCGNCCFNVFSEYESLCYSCFK